MFRPLTYLNSLCLALMGLLSCETPIDFPVTDDVSRIGVISEFTRDRKVEVQVFETRSGLQNGPVKYILNARVEIFDGDQLLETLKLNHDEEVPTYTTRDLIPQPNIEYTIYVDASGFDPVTAKSRMPNPIQIKGLQVSEISIQAIPESGKRRYNFTVLVRFKDPEDEFNYYHLNFLQEIWKAVPAEGDTLLTDPYFKKVSFSSMLHSNSLLDFLEGGVLFDDSQFDGRYFDQSFPLQFDLDEEERLGDLTVELRSVSEEYFLFQTSYARQRENPGQPIDDGVPIYNNIENGLGIFAGYNSSTTSISIIK